VCHKEDNVLVATGIRFKNARWPTYYLVASTMDDQIHVANSGVDPLARFNLYQLPGQGQRPTGFLLVPQASPGYAVSIVHKYHCDDLLQRNAKVEPGHNAKVELHKPNSSLAGGGSCKHSWNAQTQPMSPSYNVHPSVQDAAVHLSKAHVSEKKVVAITIRGAGVRVDKYMFVHAGSWKVSSRADDPGLGGYWIPEPPLAFALPEFDGPPCKHACDNSLSVRSAMAGGGLLLALVISTLSLEA